MPKTTARPLVEPGPGYDPDAVDEARCILYEWVECCCAEPGSYASTDLMDWVLNRLSLRDPRLVELAAQNPQETIGEPYAWTFSDERYRLGQEWAGGDEDAMNDWLDAFVAAV